MTHCNSPSYSLFHPPSFLPACTGSQGSFFFMDPPRVSLANDAHMNTSMDSYFAIGSSIHVSHPHCIPFYSTLNHSLLEPFFFFFWGERWVVLCFTYAWCLEPVHRCACLFPTDEVENEKWYLSTEFPSTTIKTEPITEESPPGLVPSVTLTITAISTPFEKEEPPLEMNTAVHSIVFHINKRDQKT